MHQIFQMPALVARINDVFDLILLISVLRDSGGTGGSHRLTREAFTIWLDTGDVDDGVDVHGVGKTEFHGVRPDQLRDGIGTEPTFRQLLRGMRKAEIVGGKPNLISDGICRGVRAMLIQLGEDLGMRLDQVVVGT